jgi:hypothetical protein
MACSGTALLYSKLSRYHNWLHLCLSSRYVIGFSNVLQDVNSYNCRCTEKLQTMLQVMWNDFVIYYLNAKGGGWRLSHGFTRFSAQCFFIVGWQWVRRNIEGWMCVHLLSLKPVFCHSYNISRVLTSSLLKNICNLWKHVWLSPVYFLSPVTPFYNTIFDVSYIFLLFSRGNNVYLFPCNQI